MKVASRIEKVPPYLFARIDKAKAEAVARGMDVISLGIGDPDLPTPAPIIETLRREAGKAANHQYPSYEGMPAFREAVARWYDRKWGVKLDPKEEIVSLIGSKEGIAHIYLAFCDPGDITLHPDPGYPVYTVGTLFAGGKSHAMPLKAENGFLPDFDAIPADVREKAKLMFINYPSNPTAATAPLEFFKKAVEFGKANDIIVCHDAAYSELTFDGYKSPSIMQVDGAKDIAVEFHSLSKTYNMTGWRIGFAVGNPEVIRGLSIVKTNVDSGVFQAIQYAGITALDDVGEDILAPLRDTFQERRDIVVEALAGLGWNIEKPKATFYIWVPNPAGISSIDFSLRVLNETGVIVTPGNGFGEQGEGYFRISITCDKNRISEAMERIGKLKF